MKLLELGSSFDCKWLLTMVSDFFSTDEKIALFLRFANVWWLEEINKYSYQMVVFHGDLP